jgi:hypothetical protein
MVDFHSLPFKTLACRCQTEVLVKKRLPNSVEMYFPSDASSENMSELKLTRMSLPNDKLMICIRFVENAYCMPGHL